MHADQMPGTIPSLSGLHLSSPPQGSVLFSSRPQDFSNHEGGSIPVGKQAWWSRITHRSVGPEPHLTIPETSHRRGPVAQGKLYRKAPVYNTDEDTIDGDQDSDDGHDVTIFPISIFIMTDLFSFLN